MAQVKILAPSATLVTADDFLIASPAQGGQLSALHLHIVKNSGTLSMTIKGASINAPVGTTYLAVPYCPLNASGTASDSTMVAGNIAITDSSIIMIPCSGQNIMLSCGTLTGSTSVYIVPIYGPSVI